MENWTKKQVIIAWVVCLSIGVIITLIGLFTSDSYSTMPLVEFLALVVVFPIAFAWELLTIPICFIDMIKYAFTFRFISMFGVYFKALGTVISVTFKKMVLNK